MNEMHSENENTAVYYLQVLSIWYNTVQMRRLLHPKEDYTGFEKFEQLFESQHLIYH